jgi:hypothetical protein
MARSGPDPKALDRKLQDVKKQQDATALWLQNWWPFADSQHGSESDGDSRNSSISVSSESLASASEPSGSAKRTSLHKRKLSVQDIWHDANLRSQESVSLSREQEMQSSEDNNTIIQIERHLAEQPLNQKQRRLPPRLKRSRSNLRMTKMAKMECPETIYHAFDEEAFRKRQVPPLPHRRTSLVFGQQAVAIPRGQEATDADETQEDWEDTITQNSQVATVIASKIHSPRDETLQRHDSGFALPVCNASSKQHSLDDAQYDFGPCSMPTSLVMKHDMQMVSDQGDSQAVITESPQIEHGSSCADFDFGQQACVW